MVHTSHTQAGGVTLSLVPKLTRLLNGFIGLSLAGSWLYRRQLVRRHCVCCHLFVHNGTLLALGSNPQLDPEWYSTVCLRIHYQRTHVADTLKPQILVITQISVSEIGLPDFFK